MKPASSNHYVNSSANNFPELAITYMEFNNLKASKVLCILWKIICIPNIQLHKDSVLYFLLQEESKNRFFVNLDIRYTEYFPEYAKYFGSALRSLKSMYGMNNSGNLFADELT